MFNIVTLKDINKAIAVQVMEGLKATAFKGVKFTSTDVTEKITRPSFYVDFSVNKTGLANSSLKARKLTVNLYYYGKNKIDYMDMQEQLESIFLYSLNISELFEMPIESIDFYKDKTNGFMTMTLELQTLEQVLFIDNNEFMSELEIELINN